MLTLSNFSYTIVSISSRIFFVVSKQTGGAIPIARKYPKCASLATDVKGLFFTPAQSYLIQTFAAKSSGLVDVDVVRGTRHLLLFFQKGWAISNQSINQSFESFFFNQTFFCRSCFNKGTVPKTLLFSEFPPPLLFLLKMLQLS